MRPSLARMTNNSENFQRQEGFLLLRPSMAGMIDNIEDLQLQGVFATKASVTGMTDNS